MGSMKPSTRNRGKKKPQSRTAKKKPTTASKRTKAKATSRKKNASTITKRQRNIRRRDVAPPPQLTDDTRAGGWEHDNREEINDGVQPGTFREAEARDDATLGENLSSGGDDGGDGTDDHEDEEEVLEDVDETEGQPGLDGPAAESERELTAAGEGVIGDLIGRDQ